MPYMTSKRTNYLPNFPNHIILSDRVYKLSINEKTNGRAFDRFLVDFIVEGENPLSSSDNWRTLLGVSRELFDDYHSYKLSIPLEWLLTRFLSHHVRTNSVHTLSGPGGEVLTKAKFRDYVGREVADDDAEQILRTMLCSWVRVYPEKAIRLNDVFASIDINIDVIRRGINSLKFMGHIEEIEGDVYKVKPSIFTNISLQSNLISLDRKSNRYYQEIRIEAVEPFCFVIMPFREREFPQRIYTEVIKPLVEDDFKISCYRVDEDRLPDRIDNKIYSYLLRAAFIIAEVTTLNPNVFYEIGLSHMLEKDCIVLTSIPIEEIPFDINKIRAEYYNGDENLIDILRKSISALAFKIR